MPHQKSPKPHRKKPGYNAYSGENFVKNVPTNVSLHPVKKSRAFEAAQAMGYTLSGLIEHVLDQLHEARCKRPQRKPGDYLQIELFDLLPDKDKPAKK